MKKKVTIKRTSLPTRSPVGMIALNWLLLEHIKAPEWAYGVLWTLAALFIIVFIIAFITETERDVPGFGEK